MPDYAADTYKERLAAERALIPKTTAAERAAVRAYMKANPRRGGKPAIHSHAENENATEKPKQSQRRNPRSEQSRKHRR